MSLIEAFNVLEADEMDCHIITAPADILEKLPAFGTKKAAELALDGVKTFRADAVAAGLSLQLASCADAAEWSRHGSSRGVAKPSQNNWNYAVTP